MYVVIVIDPVWFELVIIGCFAYQCFIACYDSIVRIYLAVIDLNGHVACRVSIHRHKQVHMINIPPLVVV